jgi:hypothetical protein
VIRIYSEISCEGLNIFKENIRLFFFKEFFKRFSEFFGLSDDFLTLIHDLLKYFLDCNTEKLLLMGSEVSYKKI